MAIPTRIESEKILEQENVPLNVIRHCRKVAETAVRIAEHIEEKDSSIHINKDLLIAAALLHDISRAEEGDHVLVGADKLKSLGFSEVADVAITHSLYHLPEITPETIEQKILCYADKRVVEDRIAPINERFAYLRAKYPSSDSSRRDYEYEYIIRLEKELGIEGLEFAEMEKS